MLWKRSDEVFTNGICLGFVVFLTVTLITINLRAVKGTNGMDFFAGNEPNGKPLEEWAKNYWQWSSTLPSGEIPNDSQTNLAKCFIGSDPGGAMAYLRGVYGESYVTKCNLSSKLPILIPLLTGECDPTVPELRSKTGNIEDLWACAKDADQGLISWEVTLDDRILFKKAGNEGVNLDLVDQILVRNSSLFNITMPEINRFEVEPGIYPAVIDGYYLILNPLTKGEHKLTYKFTQEQKIPGADLSYINGDATYFLTVN